VWRVCEVKKQLLQWPTVLDNNIKIDSKMANSDTGLMNKEILYVCIGNACRSIMAEALTRHYWAGIYEAASAGLSPLGRVSEGTIEVLRQRGVKWDGLYSKGIGEVDLNRFHSIVNLSEYPVGQYVSSAHQQKIINCYIRDPYGQSLDIYRQTLGAIEYLVTERVPEWLEDNKDEP